MLNLVLLVHRTTVSSNNAKGWLKIKENSVRQLVPHGGFVDRSFSKLSAFVVKVIRSVYSLTVGCSYCDMYYRLNLQLPFNPVSCPTTFVRFPLIFASCPSHFCHPPQLPSVAPCPPLISFACVASQLIRRIFVRSEVAPPRVEPRPQVGKVLEGERRASEWEKLRASQVTIAIASLNMWAPNLLLAPGAIQLRYAPAVMLYCISRDRLKNLRDCCGLSK